MEGAIVLLNVRLMDPESGTDSAGSSIYIKAGKVVAVGAEAPADADSFERVDCSGLVAAPGFIDVHSHSMNDEGAMLQACDGVTTHLELEFGSWPVEKFYEDRAEGQPPINYGCSVGHIPTRVAALTGETVGSILDECCQLTTEVTTSPSHHVKTTDAKLAELMAMLTAGIDAGAIGIGAGIGYTPAADHREVFRMMQTAGKLGVACFIHLRNGSGDAASAPLAVFHEVLTNAATTGCGLHICHTGAHLSSMPEQLPMLLEMVASLNARGCDVTLEQYPYKAGMTNISASIFDGDWYKKFGVSFTKENCYNSLQWLATGERLTKQTFDEYRKEGGLVFCHYGANAHEMVDNFMAEPTTIVASDAIPYVDHCSHPRSAGTFCRVLRVYVREERTLTLMDALRKMSYLPARRLERFCPAMLMKGRLQVGCDADITLFDHETVGDNATFTASNAPSTLSHVIVNGVFVVRDGVYQAEAVAASPPGRAVHGGRGAAEGAAPRLRKDAGLAAALLEVAVPFLGSGE